MNHFAFFLFKNAIFKKGGKFELFGGSVDGTFTELESGKKIKMLWRKKDWESISSGYYSDVTMEFEQGSDSTTISLVHNGIPEKCYEDTCLGWERNYIASINSVFGYGANFNSGF